MAYSPQGHIFNMACSTARDPSMSYPYGKHLPYDPMLLGLHLFSPGSAAAEYVPRPKYWSNKLDNHNRPPHLARPRSQPITSKHRLALKIKKSERHRKNKITLSEEPWAVINNSTYTKDT